MIVEHILHYDSSVSNRKLVKEFAVDMAKIIRSELFLAEKTCTYSYFH